MELLVFICILFSLLCNIATCIEFVEQPMGVTVVEGETFILRCVVSNKGMDNLFWKTMDSSVVLSSDSEIDPYNKSLEIRDRYSIVGNHEAGEYNLQIVNATRQDSGRYACLYYTNFNHYSRIATVRIMVPPEQGYPKCSVYPHGAIAGDTVRLTCRSSGGDPPASLAWVYDTSILRMLMPQSPNPINEVRYTLKKEDMNKVFTCAATTPALRQPLSCNVVPYRKKMFVLVEPVVNRVMEGEYATFHCRTHKKSGTIRWVIGSTPVDQSDSRFLITRKGKKLRILNTLRSENNVLVSCQVMDRFGVAGNASSVLFVSSWETTTDAPTLEPELTSLPYQLIETASTHLTTTALHNISESRSIIQPGIRHDKKRPGTVVTTLTKTLLMPTVTKAPLHWLVTKTPLTSTARKAMTAQPTVTTSSKLTNSTLLHNTMNSKLITESAMASSKRNISAEVVTTSVTTKSEQTMTKQILLTTESILSTRLMNKSTIAFNTLTHASSNVQTTRLMASSVTMEIKTDEKMHSTKNIIVHKNDLADISNDIVTRTKQPSDIFSTVSNRILIENSVTKNMTLIGNDILSHKDESNNGDEVNDGFLGKSTHVLIGGLVGLVVLIVFVIVLSIFYIKRHRGTTAEIKAV